ncbi:MAG: type II toxin-antitoxin system RelE/ParE family toxin [Thermoplasmatales archaeon]|nr:type II toxin-antitoxin system RelE/ParE family toxin [Thermoplasmatales archaeon]
MYEIYATTHFSKAFGKLDSKIQDGIRRKITEKLIENPYAGRPLHGVLRGKLRLRVGDYRVVYDIDEHKKIIYLVAVGIRPTMYR